MGKRIIQQARGKGSHTYRVRRKAFSIKPKYPMTLDGKLEVVKLVHSAGHTAPLVRLKSANGETFYNIAADGLYVGQFLAFKGKNNGDITTLDELKNGTPVFNIECAVNDGGKLIRSGGNSGVINGRKDGNVIVIMPSKQEKVLAGKCRATIGVSAGQGRLDKPILKAGKMFYIKKAKSKLYPRTSAIKVNAIDHPFGSGRGKRPKSKIAIRFASPGQKVGLIRPRRTGRTKK
jgi:large subunit ribosomal protein L2